MCVIVTTIVFKCSSIIFLILLEFCFCISWLDTDSAMASLASLKQCNYFHYSVYLFDCPNF